MTAWTLLALVACVAACGFAALAWLQRREAQRRSDARVATLVTAIDGPFEASFAGTGALEAFTAERPSSTMPARRGWMMAAGAVPLALVVAALLVTRGPDSAPPPLLARQPDALELLAMHHDRSGDLLTVTGTVRVRGRDAAPVTAVVTGRDAAGRIVASAHAPLDDAALDLGGESSFSVSVPAGHDVRRYQVRFETPLGPLTHIDRRADHALVPVTP